MSRFDVFMEQFWKNFDKLLLTLLFALVLSMCVWFTLRKDMDEGSLDWSRSTANLILGGLLGLITGKYIGAHSTTSEQTVVTTSTPDTKAIEPAPPETPKGE